MFFLWKKSVSFFLLSFYGGRKFLHFFLVFFMLIFFVYIFFFLCDMYILIILFYDFFLHKNIDFLSLLILFPLVSHSPSLFSSMPVISTHRHALEFSFSSSTTTTTVSLQKKWFSFNTTALHSIHPYIHYFRIYHAAQREI